MSTSAATKAVKIAEGFSYPVTVPATVVQRADDGAVEWNGNRIGYVWNDPRPRYRYTLLQRKDDRPFKYHKRLPEWHGHPVCREHGAVLYDDTRQGVIRKLIAGAIVKEGG